MYGTRRNSAIQTPSSVPIPLPPVDAALSPYSPSLALSPLSSSVGKSKRPSTISKARRMSNARTAPPPAAGLSLSLPGGAPLLPRGRSASVSKGEEFGEGHAPASGKKREKGQTYECEKCSKVYRHSTCLTKHRWEHTAHWKEASKLLLSKHQQVQLLEGAAILAAASAGTSLPDEKHYWPAAVSPPASGLLGSSELGINIHALNASGPAGFGSPRFVPSSLLSDGGDFDTSRSELSIDEDDEDYDEGVSPPRSGAGEEPDEDQQIMEDGMFDLDLGGSGDLPPPSPFPPAPIRLPTLSDRHVSPSISDSSSSPGPAARPAIRSSDSGFGSLGRTGTVKAPSMAATAAAVAASQAHSYVPHQQTRPVMGFFVPQAAPQ